MIWIGFHSHCFTKCFVPALATSRSCIAGGTAAVWLPPAVVSLRVDLCQAICICRGSDHYSPTLKTGILTLLRHTSPKILAVCRPCCSPACAQLHSLLYQLLYISSPLFYRILLCLLSHPEQKINILALVGSEHITWQRWSADLFWEENICTSVIKALLRMSAEHLGRKHYSASYRTYRSSLKISGGKEKAICTVKSSLWIWYPISMGIESFFSFLEWTNLHVNF